MKKTIIISILLSALLISACQTAPTTTYNSPDKNKQEKASAESKVYLTVGDQPDDKPASTGAAIDQKASMSLGDVTVK